MSENVLLSALSSGGAAQEGDLVYAVRAGADKKVTLPAFLSAASVGVAVRNAVFCGVATGTADALVLTPATAATAYFDGQEFTFKAGASQSTGTVTINVSEVGDLAARIDGAPLSASVTIEAGKFYRGTVEGALLHLTRLSEPALSLSGYMRTDQNNVITAKQAWDKQLSVIGADATQAAILGHCTDAHYGLQGLSDGNHGIYGKTASVSHWAVMGVSHDSSQVGYLGGPTYAVYAQGAMHATGNLTVAGNATVTGTVTGSDVGITSDRRLKKDIEGIAGALAKVAQLNGVTFEKRGDNERRAGLIAQDVRAVLPEATARNSDGHLIVLPVGVVGLLVEAVKALDARVTALEDQ